ncbi:MAG: hypothetical protein ACLQVD_12830 [Capsulimonadaceae bacterium]
MSRKTPEIRKPPVSVPEPEAVDQGMVPGGTVIVVLVAVMLCLIPKMGNDFFWQIRTGLDILRTGQPPHTDHYSWTEFGRRWDVPEWLAFACLAAAYHAAGFFGTWLLLVLLTVSMALVVWFDLLKRVRPFTALLLTNLTLMAMSIFLQERPYGFTYLLLAISLALVMQVREGRAGPRRLLALIPICALWANLHQGVLVLAALLAAFAAGDFATALFAGRDRTPSPGAQKSARHSLRLRAGWMGGAAAACIAAGMVSPYGWHVYSNIFGTVQDPAAMKLVTEWQPITYDAPDRIWEFYTLVVVLVAGYVFSRRRRDAGEALCGLGLLAEAALHLRNIPLCALGAVMILGPAAASGIELFRIRKRLPRVAVAGAAVIYLALVGRVCLQELTLSVGPREYTPAGIGEAAIRLSSFPGNLFDFMKAEHFPPGLRTFNNYDVGGYMIFRIPSEPVFIDGREDVYLGLSPEDAARRIGVANPRPGMTLHDYLAISSYVHPQDVAALMALYDFDCVVTSNGRVARAFALDQADWRIVYMETLPKVSPPGKNRGWILLRKRPQFQSLIKHCLIDCPAARR